MLAIRRAAERFQDADGEAARHRLHNLEAMTDDRTAEASAAHAAFHFALYDAADSAWLLRLIRPVWETSERYCLEVPECRQLNKRRREHRVILESCVEHDSDTAAIALHDHLATTANNISLAMGGEALFELRAEGSHQRWGNDRSSSSRES